MPKTIAELESDVRRRINEPQLTRDLINRGAEWDIVTSALDAIGDSEIALDSYLCWSGSEDVGCLYLLTYGVLQVLVVQQDAIRELCRALDLADVYPDKCEELKKIRDIRIHSVGHPVLQRSKKRLFTSNYIARISLTKSSFELMTSPHGKERLYTQTILVHELIASQRKALIQVLENVTEQLDERERQHRDRFKDQELAKIIRPARYHIGNVSKALWNADHWPAGKVHIGFVARAIDEFKEALKNRGEFDAMGDSPTRFQDLERPMNELAAFFEDPDQAYLDNDMAEICVSYLDTKLKSLIKIAQEIDEIYASRPGGCAQ